MATHPTHPSGDVRTQHLRTGNLPQWNLPPDLPKEDIVTWDLIIIGGGAAGFFCAIETKRHNPSWRVLILESSKDVLKKVALSGGSRCNVTHACFDVRQLVTFYPRGGKALFGLFNRFSPSDTIAWFKKHGVTLKTESDGRLFPTTDSSNTIIHCFLSQAEKLGIRIKTNYPVQQVKKDGTAFNIATSQGLLKARNIVLATGSSPEGYRIAQSLGATIVEPVPSLFTFTVKDPALRQLAGISIETVSARLPKGVGTQSAPPSNTTSNTNSNPLSNPRPKTAPKTAPILPQFGPLLITHRGLSGPAIIKLSAWAARELANIAYQFEVIIDLLPHHSHAEIGTILADTQAQTPKKQVATYSPFPEIPVRFWQYVLNKLNIVPTRRWESFPLNIYQKLASSLKELPFSVCGRNAYKDEFVTAGGVALTDIEFKNMQLKTCPGACVIGECLDIDGITGGFNFQNAWSTAYVASQGFSKT